MPRGSFQVPVDGKTPLTSLLFGQALGTGSKRKRTFGHNAVGEHGENGGEFQRADHVGPGGASQACFSVGSPGAVNDVALGRGDGGGVANKYVPREPNLQFDVADENSGPPLNTARDKWGFDDPEGVDIDEDSDHGGLIGTCFGHPPNDVATDGAAREVYAEAAGAQMEQDAGVRSNYTGHKRGGRESGKPECLEVLPVGVQRAGNHTEHLDTAVIGGTKRPHSANSPGTLNASRGDGGPFGAAHFVPENSGSVTAGGHHGENHSHDKCAYEAELCRFKRPRDLAVQTLARHAAAAPQNQGHDNGDPECGNLKDASAQSGCHQTTLFTSRDQLRRYLAHKTKKETASQAAKDDITVPTTMHKLVPLASHCNARRMPQPPPQATSGAIAHHSIRNALNRLVANGASSASGEAVPWETSQKRKRPRSPTEQHIQQRVKRTPIFQTSGEKLDLRQEVLEPGTQELDQRRTTADRKRGAGTGSDDGDIDGLSNPMKQHKLSSRLEAAAATMHRIQISEHAARDAQGFEYVGNEAALTGNSQASSSGLGASGSEGLVANPQLANVSYYAGNPLHASHLFGFLHGVLWCWQCGAWCVGKTAALAKPCNKRPTRAGDDALARLAKGMTPRTTMLHWPALMAPPPQHVAIIPAPASYERRYRLRHAVWSSPRAA